MPRSRLREREGVLQLRAVLHMSRQIARRLDDCQMGRPRTVLSVPQDEVAYIELKRNRKIARRLNMVLGALAFAFILVGLGFIGYYSYTKYVQIQETPEQKEIAKATKAIK